MFLTLHECYHVYNRGNNKQPIFFNTGNYLFFIKKIRIHLLPVSDILAYCLMPNHFHLLVHANENSIRERKTFGGKPMQQFSYQLGVLQSSYAQAINKQNHTSGSLFQQKTKAKELSEEKEGRKISYLDNCLAYIHQNPKESGLADDLSQWPFSSYLDYCGNRKGTLCNKELLYQLTGTANGLIYNGKGKSLTKEEIKKLLS